MLMDFVATISAGVGLAGVVMAIRHFTRGKLPKYVIPAFVGLGMLIFSIWNEYSWFPRVREALPEEVVILSAPTDRVAYRPWTYLFPVSTRFVALDGTSVRPATGNPSLQLADAMIVQRWVKTVRIPMAFDCAQNLRADLVEGAAIGADGTLSGVAWQRVDATDELQVAACQEG